MRISIGSSFRLPKSKLEAAVNRNDVLTSVGPGIAQPAICLPSAPGAASATSMASAQDRAMADDILALKE
ncbi:MAG TPA: hypothetical protein VMU47_16935 [Caldimonas sp.]|nr:hypothetical protein [Caldimonas sp.]